MKLPSDIVLDCSMTLAWFFEDEATPETDALFLALPGMSVVVPDLWYLELANSLNVALARKRTDEKRIAQFVEMLLKQPIAVDHASASRALSEVRPLARKHQLSVYDAVYLDLALRTKRPLATLDKKLVAACDSAAVAVVAKPAR